jgi:hypothetical protein
MRGFPGDRAKIVPERARRAPSRTSRHAQLSQFFANGDGWGFSRVGETRARARSRLVRPPERDLNLSFLSNPRNL